MQDKVRVIDSLLEVLREKLIKREDCIEIVNQIGAVSVPKLTACRVLPLKSKFEFVDTKA